MDSHRVQINRNLRQITEHQLRDRASGQPTRTRPRTGRTVIPITSYPPGRTHHRGGTRIGRRGSRASGRCPRTLPRQHFRSGSARTQTHPAVIQTLHHPPDAAGTTRSASAQIDCGSGMRKSPPFGTRGNGPKRGEIERLLITGVAGVGKSTLLLETLRRAEISRCVIIRVTCQEVGSRIPYAALTQILEGLMKYPRAQWRGSDLAGRSQSYQSQSLKPSFRVFRLRARPARKRQVMFGRGFGGDDSGHGG